MKSRLLIIWLSALLAGCSADTSKIDALYEKGGDMQESLKDLEMTYSDSARVLLTVKAPEMITREEDRKIIEEFPKGLQVEFYQQDLRPNIWLKAGHALRFPEEKKVIVSQHVQLYNAENDKLETSELIWDEGNQKIYTDKFIRLTQPGKGDTTYGFGFMSDLHFTRFEVKRKFSGKIEETMLRELSSSGNP
ncbi:MAG TPA: LPS export ABC transporter periplasmic protein LptC [Saprospirales bacterium]|nr:LPS export ABC transporter periplasmic protein LptC [Saprospirales bacterium]HAY70401.1 LPS export ABC transporter periplasmic protein LptC [Saprospirales bacterium]HRQ29186.1 LPS export ABC transporter periplasmic protein LptC [Saprospiraceae bacterium]